MDDSHTGLSNFIWIFFLLTYWKMPFGVFPFDKKKKKKRCGQFKCKFQYVIFLDLFQNILQFHFRKRLSVSRMLAYAI